MGMSCDTCQHNNRLEIDREIIQGKSYQSIANTYGVSAQAIRRHKESGHITRQLVQAMAVKQADESLDLMGELESVLETAKEILQRSLDRDTLSGDSVALRSLGEVRASLELVAKISAYLMETQRNPEDEQAETDMQFREHITRLNDAELGLFQLLLEKLNGKYDKVILREGKEGRYRSAGEILKLQDVTEESRPFLEWAKKHGESGESGDKGGNDKFHIPSRSERATDKIEIQERKAMKEGKPYQGMDLDLTIESDGSEPIGNPDPAPKKMTRTKKPAQGVKPVEPITIPGARNKRLARIARQKAGIGDIARRANRRPNLLVSH